MTIGDPAVAAGSLVVRAASSNPALVPAGGLVIGGSGASRTLTVTPTAGMSGTAIIAVSVSGGRDAAVESFLRTVGSYQRNGSGVWDTLSSNWNGAGTMWPTLGNANDAVFGGAPGFVAVQGGVTVDDITFNTSGYEINGSALNFAPNPVITVASSATATISAPLAGAATLAKEGLGTLVLTGDTPYAGALSANAGTLLVQGDVSAAASAAVRSGATLAGSGRLPATVVEAGGQLSPGPGIGLLRTEALTLQTGAALRIDLGLVNDQIAVAGDLALGGNLFVNLTETPANGAHTIITYGGARTGTMSLGGAPAGYTMSLDYSVAGEVRLLVSGGFERLALIPAGAEWKLNAAGADLAIGWRQLGYYDGGGGWPTGPAEIGYGDGDEATRIAITSGKPQIIYFRKSFFLTASNLAGMSRLVLSLLRDDGAVVFLNGLEVRRDNFPAPPAIIAFNTPANAVVADEAENVFYATTVDPSLLNVGPNVLAVEVHQEGPASSDLSFDLRLDAVLSDPDTDDDGLIDAWELASFGSLGAQTGGEDADADGASNFTEMKARTSPLDRAQTFSIIASGSNASGQMTVSWPTVPGVAYAIQRSENLTDWATLVQVEGNGTVRTFWKRNRPPARRRSSIASRFPDSRRAHRALEPRDRANWPKRASSGRARGGRRKRAFALLGGTAAGEVARGVDEAEVREGLREISELAPGARKRGTHIQSIEPLRPTSATVCISPMTP